ncbi:hypothetical protein [Desulfogranum mediterraneum]|uniref:hypothetical protein n=1 Tax=Desulfogranum mediterraneum TaxID=160661 RepID=UPI00040A38C1|nr:hypothetical protein [Desulfogranum mediterraneum]
MKEQQAASAVRVKEQQQNLEILKDDLQLKKETGKLGILLLFLIGIVVGGLSLTAMISGLLRLLTG